MTQGVLQSIMASVLFGAMYYYASWLAPLSGEQIFGWRMLLALPALTLFLRLTGESNLITTLLKRLKGERHLWIGLPLSAALMGVQLWLFMWAPVNGKALEVSLGYFMMPLVLVLIGRFYYGERLSQLQIMATACAVLGVCHEIYQAGSFPWVSQVVALGYPAYFVLRRELNTGDMGGLWFDIALALPVAAWFALGGEANTPATWSEHPHLYLQVPFLGVLSIVAMGLYSAASKHLPMALFGLLGYVEPVLLVIAALLIGEMIEPQEWLTYLPIWLAVGLLALDGLRAWHRQRASLNPGA